MCLGRCWLALTNDVTRNRICPSETAPPSRMTDGEHAETRPWGLASNIRLKELRGLRRGQSLVFPLRIGRQQHPHRVHAERSSEGNICEQGDEAQDQRENPRPALVLQQAPSGDEPQRSFCQ